MQRIRKLQGDRIAFGCLGCGEMHQVTSAWTWNESMEHPTITPSILVKTGHYSDESRPCWCAYNKEKEEAGEPTSPFKCSLCHSFISNGEIRYLDDCSHELAGKTIMLPDVTVH